MRALLLPLLLAAAPALADAIARQGNDWVHITPRPCTTEAVLARLEGDARLDFRQATAEFQGVVYAPCWKPMGNGIYLVYEDGDQGIVSAHELTPLTDI